MVTTTPEIETATRFLHDLFAPAPPRHVAFRLWDDSIWPDEQPRAATLILNHPGALRAMFAPGTEMGLAEAFLRDDFDIAGDIEAAFEITDSLGQHGPQGWLNHLRTYYQLHRLPKPPARAELPRTFRGHAEREHSLPRDRQAVSFHYDVSNDFFRLWLDRQMIYSCAYFERPDVSLDAAQEAKCRHICRKLRLQPGQRLLDIGCGWGGLARFAARHYGVSVTGVSLSQRQVELARERVQADGLDGRVEIALKDYRELRSPGHFDAIVSVGMSEHVGGDQLGNYFKTAGALLKPGGVFLNHAIGEGVRTRPNAGPSFIAEYVFPDSDVPAVPKVLAAAESAELEVRDVENLREHYALTLRHWVHRLEAAHGEALDFVDEATYRVWRLYMAGSAHGFARGHLAIYQALLSKPDPAGKANLPLTRREWYPAS